MSQTTSETGPSLLSGEPLPVAPAADGAAAQSGTVDPSLAPVLHPLTQAPMTIEYRLAALEADNKKLRAFIDTVLHTADAMFKANMDRARQEMHSAFDAFDRRMTPVLSFVSRATGHDV